jgi:ATP synthase protein I
MTDNRDDGLEERRKRLSAELAGRRAEDAAEAKRDAQSEESRKGMALGLKISSEFIAAVAVGAVLGYLLGLAWPASKPWGLIILLLLGFCAGVLNVLRAVGMVAPPTSLTEGSDKNGKGSGR